MVLGIRWYELLKALGDGRSRYNVTLTRSRHRRRCHRYRPARHPDRRPIAKESRGGMWRQIRRTLFHGTPYKGIADTIVQLIRCSTSRVIAPSQPIRDEHH